MSKQTVICVFPPFAIFVLARIWSSPSSLISKLFQLLKIFIAVTLTTAILLYPLITTNSVPEMMNRVFPPYRRIMEEISPSLWNLINAIKRIRYVDPLSDLGFKLKIAAFSLTIISVLPSFLALLKAPTNRRFILAIQISALSSFLFGYCIHSKALIYALAPMHLSFFDHNDLSLLLCLMASFPTARYIYYWCEADVHYRFVILSFMLLYFTFYSSLPSCNPVVSAPLSSFKLCSHKFFLNLCYALSKLQYIYIMLIIIILEICEFTLTKPETQPGIFIAISHVLIFFLFLAVLFLMNLKIWLGEEEVRSIDKQGHMLPALQDK